MVQYTQNPTLSFWNNSNWSFLYLVPKLQLYEFTSHTFTNCGQTGTTGPSLATCKTSYSPSWTDNTSYFNVQTAGYQEWTVPYTGTFRISAYGAQGGPNAANNNQATAGNGAYVRGDFSLVQGDVIYIAIGQMGSSTSEGAGGGGGTYVIKKSGASYTNAVEADILASTVVEVGSSISSDYIQIINLP